MPATRMASQHRQTGQLRARALPLFLPLASLLLASCGNDREAELERELFEARAQAADAAAAQQKAERAAAAAQERLHQSYSNFYDPSAEHEEPQAEADDPASNLFRGDTSPDAPADAAAPDA